MMDDRGKRAMIMSTSYIVVCHNVYDIRYDTFFSVLCSGNLRSGIGESALYHHGSRAYAELERQIVMGNADV